MGEISGSNTAKVNYCEHTIQKKDSKENMQKSKWHNSLSSKDKSFRELKQTTKTEYPINDLAYRQVIEWLIKVGQKQIKCELKNKTNVNEL